MTISREDFHARYKKAQGRADEWSSILEACFYYAVPFRNRFSRNSESQGSFANAQLYDSTGVEATKSFVSKIHTIMTPPLTQWGFLVIDEDDPNLSPDSHTEAQKTVSDYMRNVFKYIHKSNFDVIVGEAYFDLAVSTACVVCNYHSDKMPLMFTSIPVDQLAIEESIDGTVKTWFRTWKEVKISEITHRWRNAVLSVDMVHRLRVNPNATVKLIEGVTFNPANDMPYTYSVYEHGVSEEPILDEDVKTNKAVIWRFQKTNNEWWGRGPVMDALPSLMRANEMAKIEFASANLNVFRPYLGFSDNVFNPYTFELKPMSVIPIAPISANGQVPLIPLPDSSNPAFAQMTIQDLRAQINNLMFADPLGPVDAPSKTATELSLRQQNLAEKIGPLFTRLQQEFLWPVLEVSMDTLHDAGILLKPQLEGVDIKFEYRSPLALAKGQQDLSVFTQYVQVLQGIMGPDVTQFIINNQEAPYILAEWMQIDPRLLNTKSDVKRIAEEVQARQQAAQAQQQEQQIAQEGSGGPGEPLEEEIAF